MAQTTMPNFTAECALEGGNGTYASTRNYGDSGRGVTPQIPPWLIATRITPPPPLWAEFSNCTLKRFPRDVKITPDYKIHVFWNCAWVCGNSVLLTWDCGESVT